MKVTSEGSGEPTLRELISRTFISIPLRESPRVLREREREKERERKRERERERERKKKIKDKEKEK